MIVDRSDFLGMSRGLFPPSGLQSKATVAGRSCDIRSTWSIICTLLLMMVVLRPALFILLRISLLVILPCQCTPRIFLRHLFWKVSSCLLDFIVLIQVSAAYVAVDMAIALNSLSFVLQYTFKVLQIFSNFLNTPAPLSAPDRISNSHHHLISGCFPGMKNSQLPPSFHHYPLINLFLYCKPFVLWFYQHLL